MKKIIMAMAAVSALAIGAPAAAQSDMDRRLIELQNEIQTGVRSGAIDRVEAAPLREQLRELRRLERQYGVGGFSLAERQDLNTRMFNLHQQINFAERGMANDYRYGQRDWIDRNRDGFDDRDFDRDGRWTDDVSTRRYGSADFIDRNRDGFDDRDVDRDGRWTDDVRYGSRYGMGGPYDEVSQVCGLRGAGFAGVIGSLLGADRCLDIGERAPANLSALPWQYRSQFRDGGGYYHRWVNGTVVQIDARTGTVVRIYDVD